MYLFLNCIYFNLFLLQHTVVIPGRNLLDRLLGSNSWQCHFKEVLIWKIRRHYRFDKLLSVFISFLYLCPSYFSAEEVFLFKFSFFNFDVVLFLFQRWFANSLTLWLLILGPWQVTSNKEMHNCMKGSFLGMHLFKLRVNCTWPILVEVQASGLVQIHVGE